ncbi:replication-associated recombination protein A [Luteolibacter flavescens]|uniref:Replication-associated recombination protein A n=1 Tax=Luteolibacter flavescens TaxID=1859460 RepID=A0ABT3FIQ4_9BACT|nr:replication-associated recombination protein A [Luteolibacter flavescens]MCW1883449.1 replication-associated recombination protein A [Luteolibacter flavescens]
MPDLFDVSASGAPRPDGDVSGEPLASRMRPRTLDEIAGQKHILGEGKLLRRAIEADRFASLIFYGPPGTGKTTLASVIARSTGSRFEALNGVESNVAEIRAKIDQARTWRDLRGETTILFIDEIHRFNKAQQDVLLPHIERGTVRFIGATTHNPYFYVNSPLVSRSQIFQLESVSTDDLLPVLQRALANEERGFGALDIQVDADALQHLATMSDGDVRKALTSLELAVLTTPPETDGSIRLTLAVAEESIQRKAIVYDADGDAHYDTASAFIKSIRGSDPDAALYWLAKMLHAGEDPRFIARRLVISASEDIGLADSNALRVAMAAQQAFEFVGMPEGRIPLAHATVYLATAPKSSTAYAAIGAAMADVEKGRTLAVPEHLRTKTRKKLAVASGTDEEKMRYLYAHDYEGGYVPQAYLPEGRVYYHPGENGMEKRIKERMDYFRQLAEREKGE